MITNENEIKEAIHIYDVISLDVVLKKSGNIYKGLCPFHNENTPSFTVYPKTNTYKCFGCGQGGDSISFLMKAKKMTYPQALSELAKISNVKIIREKVSPEKQAELSAKQAEHMLMKFAAEFYQNACATGTNIDLDGRTYSKETLQDFQVSINDTYSALVDELQYVNIDIQLAQKLMLVGRGSSGYYDSYHHRVIFPIHSPSGKVVAIAGRILRKQKKNKEGKLPPKYINSRESNIYKKSAILYGLHQSKEAIADREFVYVVEGYTDVLTMHDNGIKNVVAKSGTSFTKEQMKLIRKYTDTIVYLTDSDPAGMLAMSLDILELESKGFRTSTVTLPQGEDPDSYLRKIGSEKFKEYIDEQTTDGLIWKIESTIGKNIKKDPYKIEKILDQAAYMLAQKKGSLIDYYVDELTKPSRLGSVKKRLLKKIATRQAEQKEASEVVVDENQAADIQEYNIYEQNNRYWSSASPKSFGYPITNFIIKPIMLIIGKEKSVRLFELINKEGYRVVTPIAAEDFLELKTFWKKITGYGEFTFNEHVTPAHFIRIHRKVIHKMTTCQPILALGQHPEGFYSFGNGIIAKGQFIPADKYGVVTYEKTSYYLPTAAEKTQNDGFSMDFHKGYIYQESSIKMGDWMHLFYKVHSENGVIGMLWVLGAIFRDIWFAQFQSYPLLNLFGPPGLGKNYFGRSIIALWGNPSLRKPILAAQNTDAGIYGVLAQLTNGVPWVDEFNTDLDRKKIDAIKGAYDSTGRTKRNGSDDRATTTTDINSALMFSGQFLPVTPDPAVYERCIPLDFDQKDFSAEDIQNAAKLKEWENTGALTSILGEIHKHRDYIQENYYEAYLAVSADIKEMLAQKKEKIKERFITNFAVILTMRKLLGEKLPFPFAYDTAKDIVIRHLLEQANVIQDENDIAVFWKIIQNLISTSHLTEDAEWMIQTQESIKVIDSIKKTTVDLTFEPSRVFFLRITKAGELYRKEFKQQYSKNGFSDKAIQFYLKQSDAFLGVIKGKRFKHGTYRCLAFKFDALGIEIANLEEDAPY